MLPSIPVAVIVNRVVSGIGHEVKVPFNASKVLSVVTGAVFSIMFPLVTPLIWIPIAFVLSISRLTVSPLLMVSFSTVTFRTGFGAALT